MPVDFKTIEQTLAVELQKLTDAHRLAVAITAELAKQEYGHMDDCEIVEILRLIIRVIHPVQV